MHRQLIFRTKTQHHVSWRHPRSKHWHQFDMILFRRAALKNVLHTRSYHSADCHTGHPLVCCNIRLQPKRFNRSKQQGNTRIDVSKMSQPNSMSQFADAFEGVRCPAAQRLCRGEGGNSPRHHASHSPLYLREKYLKYSRLI